MKNKVTKATGTAQTKASKVTKLASPFDIWER